MRKPPRTAPRGSLLPPWGQEPRSQGGDLHPTGPGQSCRAVATTGHVSSTGMKAAQKFSQCLLASGYAEKNAGSIQKPLFWKKSCAFRSLGWSRWIVTGTSAWWNHTGVPTPPSGRPPRYPKGRPSTVNSTEDSLSSSQTV